MLLPAVVLIANVPVWVLAKVMALASTRSGLVASAAPRENTVVRPV